jgi:hypothetical protein
MTEKSIFIFLKIIIYEYKRNKKSVLRGAEQRSNPNKNEIAAPFALNTMRCRASGSQ